MTPRRPRGERYDEVKGYYFERRPRDDPGGLIGTRALPRR